MLIFNFIFSYFLISFKLLLSHILANLKKTLSKYNKNTEILTKNKNMKKEA